MKENDIIIGNKLIAEFMDYTNNYWYQNNNLSYHASWDSLMPVYKKCYDIWIPNFREIEKCADIFENIWSALWHCNIIECHSEIVEFIKWHNKEQSIQVSDTTEAQ